MQDLIAEGMAALDQAASNFRPDREGGARFSTFAGTAVYRNMLRAVHSYGRVVPLPARMHQTMVQVSRQSRQGRGQGGQWAWGMHGFCLRGLWFSG